MNNTIPISSMIELKDMISLLGLLIANGIALAGVFTKLNIKITEIYRDVVSVKADLEEHKNNNKLDLKEFKETILRDKVESKSDHDKIVIALSEIATSISDLRVDIAKISTRQDIKKK